jgi:hypothetical protein
MKRLSKRSKPAKRHKMRCVRYHKRIVDLAYAEYYKDAILD